MAISGNGLAIEYCDDYIKEQNDILMIALKNNPESL